MARYAVVAALALGVSLFLVSGPPSGAAGDDEIQKVLVTNLPPVQRVSGLVGVDGPVRTATFAAIEEVEVPPAKRSHITRLIDGGTIATDGFGTAVLSLTVAIKGRLLQDGKIGAILVPEAPAISRVLEEKGQLQFPLEVSAAATTTAAYFTSDQLRHTVAFPGYRVWFYNDTETTVMVNLYAYLTH